MAYDGFLGKKEDYKWPVSGFLGIKDRIINGRIGYLGQRIGL